MDGCGERMVMGWYGDEWWCLVQKKQHQLTKVKKRGSIGGRFASPNTSIEFQVSSARQDLEWFRRLQNIRWIWYDLIWSDMIWWFDIVIRCDSKVAFKANRCPVGSGSHGHVSGLAAEFSTLTQPEIQEFFKSYLAAGGAMQRFCRDEIRPPSDLTVLT